MKFGEYLKQLRKSQGVTSTFLSAELGKARTYISQIERGLIKRLDPRMAQMILKRLGKTESEIVDILNHYHITNDEVEQVDLNIKFMSKERLIEIAEYDAEQIYQLINRLPDLTKKILTQKLRNE